MTEINKQDTNLKNLDDKPSFISYECKLWYLNDGTYKTYHRLNDLPAIEYLSGSKQWYVNGQRHRDGDYPAIITKDGDKLWYKYGKRHRDNDLPAVEWANGDKMWYIDGKKIAIMDYLQMKAYME
jgi:hypothetical protein